MNRLTLFELTDTIMAIIDDIVDAEIAGDTDEIATLFEELDTHYIARTEKHEGYVHVIKNAEAARFTTRAKALMALAGQLKDNLRIDLEEHGEKTATAGKFKISRQNGTSRVVLSIELSELPPAYHRIPFNNTQSSYTGTADRNPASVLPAFTAAWKENRQRLIDFLPADYAPRALSEGVILHELREAITAEYAPELK